MKALIKLTIAALIVHATWRAGAAYWQYYQFRDGVQQIAQFSGKLSENELHSRVLEVGRSFEVPLEPGRVNVRRRENHTLIDASYDERIEVFPRYYYPWQFNVKADAFTIVAKN